MKNVLFIGFCLILISFSISAALNVTLSDQGTDVKDKSTGAIVNSSNLTVEIYDSLTGGNLIYNETFVNGIVNGTWNLILGENNSNTLALEFGKAYYKDYKINDQDLDFTNLTGDTIERQLFYSPLGDIGGEDVNQNANLTINNLGIGITSPTQKLDVNGSVNITGNLTLGDKITFRLGEIIDNLVSGWVKITGSLNVTGNITAGFYFGDGSQLTGISSGIWDNVSGVATYDGNVNVTGNLIVAGIKGNLLHVNQERSSGTQGGTCTAGSYLKRSLTTIKTNEIAGASLVFSRITLPAGTYYAEWRAPAGIVRQHKTKLRDITNSVDLIIGSSEYDLESWGQSVGVGRFTLSGSTQIELQHRCTTTRNNDGFGVPSSYGEVEVYSEIKIWRISD